MQQPPRSKPDPLARLPPLNGPRKTDHDLARSIYHTRAAKGCQPQPAATYPYSLRLLPHLL
ncbi:hypothetical protein BDV93DRAFT_527221 [Ceratobasidium sp. AG-I]|nr:hypothetical protein BDV93DRAFT_527221 [Ceratobasidium sp. AG-I]